MITLGHRQACSLHLFPVLYHDTLVVCILLATYALILYICIRPHDDAFECAVGTRHRPMDSGGLLPQMALCLLPPSISV